MLWWVAGGNLAHFVHAGCQNPVGTLRRLMADGRYAPSPTGAAARREPPHGPAGLALRPVGGSRIRLRVDDLDPADARPELALAQIRDLAAIGLDWDPPVVHQSERRADHEAAVAALEAMGRTYECWCTRREIREAARRAARAAGRLPRHLPAPG